MIMYWRKIEHKHTDTTEMNENNCVFFMHSEIVLSNF